MLRTIALLLLLAVPVGGAAVELDDFKWLEGSWGRETRNGTSVETWTRVSESTMEGIVTVALGDSLVVTEYLRLEQMGADLFYTAKPRENAFPTPFRLIGHEGHRFVFENPAHDFPQKIVYTAGDGEGLLVEIGTLEEGARMIEFRFGRTPGR